MNLRRRNLRAWALYRFPDRTAYIFGDKHVTFREMTARAARVANGLHAIGLRTGDKVAILLNNSQETLECTGGIPLLGLTAISLNPRHSAQEHAYVLNDCEARALILHADFLDLLNPIFSSVEKLEHIVVIGAGGEEPTGTIPYERLVKDQPETAPAVEVGDDHVDRIAYTSGTTGRPKGAVSTPQIGANRVINILINLDQPIVPSDVHLVVGPLAHAAGVMSNIYHTRGATNIILSRFDEEGFIFIMDRKNDMIISGGFNIYPREVEDALMAHPGVAEAAVIGVPDDVWGESVKAFVVRRQGVDLEAEEVIQFCKENLASYKKPKTVDFVEDLPKNAYGKVLRKDLKEPFWKGLNRRV